MEGQMTIFDFVDMPYGRTCQAHSVREIRKERTTASSLKSSAKSSSRMPLFLDLRTANGQTLGASWDRTGVSLGEFMTHSSSAFPKEENGFVSYAISMDSQLQKFCLTLNCSEKPREAIPSKLSDILVENPDPKYSLSQRACQGILNRADKRGKALPEELRKALERQAVTP